MSLSPYRFLVEIKNRKVYNIMDCKFEEDKCEMKKFAAIAMMLIMCVGLLAGCGSYYAADESTVFVLKNGQIVSTDVEDFNEDTYDVDGLKTYVKDAVDSLT